MVTKKKGKLLKFVGTLAFVVSIVSVSPITSFAAEGGWTEGEGNWVGSSSTTNPNLISPMSSTTPDKHWATYDYKDENTYLAKRVVAHTNWTGMYHYSRARFESSIFGIEGDSGRVWGMDKTVAYSGYVDPSFTVAHTYWGN